MTAANYFEYIAEQFSGVEITVSALEQGIVQIKVSGNGDIEGYKKKMEFHKSIGTSIKWIETEQEEMQ